MVKSRVKKVVVSGVTAEQAEAAFADFAKADAKIQHIQSKMDMEMTRIREKYADELAKLSETRDECFGLMQTFATEKREELFSKRKSYESAHGVFGFRTGTPKLKNMKGFTWASVTNMVKEFLPEYIRTAEELAKDKLLADREKEEVAELFPKCGIIVVQDETFYVEPKKENEQPS
jgi:phage host-nuclease inhibitor protein Gam